MKNIVLLLLTLTLSLTVASIASAQSLIGAWTYGNTSSPDSSGTGVIVFLDNGVYLQAESENTDSAPGGSTGIERGTYTWSSNELTVLSTLTDTNGDVGLSDLVGAGALNLVVTGNTFTFDGDSFPRVTGTNDLVGAWSFGDTLNPGSENTGALIFLENGVYFHIEEWNDGISGGSTGMERGTYSWNAVDGTMTWNTVIDTNGDLGMSDIYSGVEITITGNSLSAINTDGDGIGTFSASRVSAVPEPSTYAMIVGTLFLGMAILRRRKLR